MSSNNVLALDVGEKRVGLALARANIRVPVVIGTLERQNADFWQQLADVINQQDITLIVIGLPRGLEGQETAQTRYARAFAKEFDGHFSLPIHWQDEALTSVQAETVLKNGGKEYKKTDIDAVAASLILSDYLQTEKITP